ncbi:hypothetical protein E1K32_20155 [Salmonella enterica subsp. enterica serovar Newport]|nr:hypothetical protein [Salmonella enterica subsp. enterica serovar Newport]
MAGADLRLAAECYGDMDSYAMYTCLRTSLRISLRIHHNGKSTVSFVFPPCWLSPMGPTSTYQCSYLLCRCRLTDSNR